MLGYRLLGLLIVANCVFIVGGCLFHQSTPDVRCITTKISFRDPIGPAVYELPSGALATWRKYADCKPALVIFSTHPLLDPLPKEDVNKIREFVRLAPPSELVRRGMAQVADPMLTSPQTVSAAIESGLISELVFVQPTTSGMDKISLPAFQQKVLAANFLSEREALALELKDGIITGTVRGLPFRCVHPDALPKIKGPVLVHIDLGFFKDLYVNDIKTPAYDLIYQTATGIGAAEWATLAVTLSYSNQEAEFSLETRFMISNLADLAAQPSLLLGGTPPGWKLRADARMARAMFAESTADELIAQNAELNPIDPDALYARALLYFVQKQTREGFSLLDRAVAIDPGYALAYLELAESGVEQNQWEKSEELMQKAATAFPDNPFIRIGQADLLIRRERGREALPLLRELQQLPWSRAYHPGVPALLKEMLEVATEQEQKNLHPQPNGTQPTVPRR